MCFGSITYVFLLEKFWLILPVFTNYEQLKKLNRAVQISLHGITGTALLANHVKAAGDAEPMA